MNNLTIKNYNGINVTDSREVAEMVGKAHDKLLRDIRGYMEIISRSPKLESEKFFIESEYLNSRNQKQPCYLLTKQGCEMVANKMTGEKGVLFTAEYVQAFNKMEQHIKEPKQLSPMEQLKLQYQVLEEHEERFTKIENQLESLEVNPSQRKRLQNARHKKVFSILGGKKSVAYKNASFRSKVYSDLGRSYNNYFDVTAYDCTPKNRFDEALEFIDSYNLSTELTMELKKINNQVSFEEAM